MRLAGVLFVLFFAREAVAQWVVVHSEGQRIDPVGVVPVEQRDAVRKLTSLGAVQVGFVYDFAAIYTLDLWRSDGRFCLYMDKQYWILEPEGAAILLGVSDVSRPIAYFLPPGLVALLALVLLVLGYRRYGERLADWAERRERPPA